MEQQQQHLSPQIHPNSYDLKAAVKLPERQGESEWIAINLYEFHKQICLLFRTISEYCTRDSCPKMTAGKCQYHWLSGPQNQISVEYTASQYINYLLDSVQEQLDDERLFPTSPRAEFPENFKDICKTIAKRLLRVYGHIHHHHIDRVRRFNEEAHMNTGLKHFIYFVIEFDLVTKDHLEPVRDWINLMLPS